MVPFGLMGAPQDIEINYLKEKIRVLEACGHDASKDKKLLECLEDARATFLRHSR